MRFFNFMLSLCASSTHGFHTLLVTDLCGSELVAAILRPRGKNADVAQMCIRWFRSQPTPAASTLLLLCSTRFVVQLLQQLMPCPI